MVDISTGFKGRDIDFEWNSAELLGVREKGISLNGDPINVTSDEDDGWQLLLADVGGEDKVEVSISGVTKSEVLKTDWFNRTRTRSVEITYPNGSVLSGTFFLASYSDTGPYNDGTTFEATLQSSGEVIFTPYS